MSVYAGDYRGIFVSGLRSWRVKQVFVEDNCQPHCGLTAAYGRMDRRTYTVTEEMLS